MLFNAAEVGRDVCLRDCVVVLPVSQKDFFDLTVCESGCTFVDTWDDLPADCEHVALLDIRLEETDHALKWVLQSPQRRLTIGLPPQWADNAEQIFDATNSATLVGYQRSNALILLRIRASQADDRPIEDFLAGRRSVVELGIAPVASAATEGADEVAVELAAQFANVLMLLDEYPLEKPVTVEVTDGPEVMDSEEIKRLRNELIKMTNAHDALQRKYDALATSRLGAFTLKRWEKRKKARD